MPSNADMDFALPSDLVDYLAELDAFIEAEIKPLEQADDNIRFFDHRREHARTDWDNDGLPRHEWEALLAEARRRADAAGHLRYAWPVEWGGKGGTNLAMAVIREHLAAKGLGLHNDLQTEHSIVGNNPFIIMFKEFATNAQYERYGEALQKRRDPHRLWPDRAQPRLRRHLHGDARRCAKRRTASPGWRINGEKMWTTGMHVANYIMTLRPHVRQGRRRRAASPSSWCRPTRRA